MNPVVKICGMREHDNILAAARLEPDVLGFIFYRDSPRYAGETLEPETLDLLPKNIRKTGVFVNAEAEKIIKTAIRYRLDIVQLHGDESPEVCMRLKDKGIGVMKVFRIGDTGDFSRCAEYTSCTDFFLFDTKSDNHGGSGEKFNWELLGRYDCGHPFFLSGGIGPSDALNLSMISNPLFLGVDLNSRFEIKPGLKDIGKLEIFISELRKKNKS